MKGKLFIKKLTLYSSLIAFLFVLSSSNINKKSKEFFRNNMRISKGKIEYSLGTIIIGDKKRLDSLKELGTNDILVLDERNDDDPNFKIYNSYRIVNSDIREEIIEGLLYYEDVYPTNWDRSKESMTNEWTIHDIMHFLGIQLDHTTDVDLNNADEEKYIVKNLFR